MEILRVENVTKKYGKDENTVYALDNVSFSVNKGEFIAIVGPSGSGKSTLLHILGGVDRATSGNVYVNGTNLSDLNENNLAIFRRRQVGIIYQFYNLIPSLNVRENIMLPLTLDGKKPDNDKVDNIISSLNLEGRDNHLPNQLSGGQQQRVSIGRAIVNNPAIVLADEPTGNLDSKNSNEVIELLIRANKTDNQTLIIITHNESIALQADRIISICDGKIVNDETIRNIRGK